MGSAGAGVLGYIIGWIFFYDSRLEIRALRPYQIYILSCYMIHQWCELQCICNRYLVRVAISAITKDPPHQLLE